MSDLTITHDRAAGRFQALVDGQRCVLDYQLDGKLMQIVHTGVPGPLEGRGLAAQLVRAALAEARAQGWWVRPVCSYVRVYMQRHAETQDLLERR